MSRRRKEEHRRKLKRRSFGKREIDGEACGNLYYANRHEDLHYSP
jgi:hypothetical protein